jgi:hypothetical protein
VGPNKNNEELTAVTAITYSVTPMTQYWNSGNHFYQVDLVFMASHRQNSWAGWRRLTPAELLHLDIGSFFLLSIPPNLRHEDSDVIKLRKAFTKRITKAVICSKRNDFPENGQSIQQRAIDYLHQHNGLIRNGSQYI